MPAKATRHLISINDAADYAGVSPRTIRRRIATGDLRGFRLGPRLIRVDRNEIDALLRPIPTVGGGPDAA